MKSSPHFTSHQLFRPPLKSQSKCNFFINPPFSLQNWFHNSSKFDSNNKHKIKIMPALILKAVSSSSYSNCPEKLNGEQVKKKRRRIAGIDQDELLDPIELADHDSCFSEFKGVHLHYKVCEPKTSILEEQNIYQLCNSIIKLEFPMILLHGFGASAFSWHRVMEPFAHIFGSKILAFDRPAFGLTSRVSHSVRSHDSDDTTPLNPYFMGFSVMATLYFIDVLKAEKAVLVGHSAGALTAMEAYFEAPDRVAALILVAPALVAPLSASKSVKENRLEKENQSRESNFILNQHLTLLMRNVQVLLKFSRYIAYTIMKLQRVIMNMVSSLYKNAVVGILRSDIAVTLVRMVVDKFGIAVIRNSWYDGNQVTDHTLKGYTKPLRTKDWDKALMEYTIAMLTEPPGKLKPPLGKRLQDIECPVLIITGDHDRLVPCWNSKRLSRAIPGSQLEIIKKCGHLPHEEKPDEFISVVAKFLHKSFAGSKDFERD